MADKFPQPRQLLYARKVSRHVLGDISESQQRRLERAKLLRVVKPSGKPRGHGFNPVEDVHRLAGIDEQADEQNDA